MSDLEKLKKLRIRCNNFLSNTASYEEGLSVTPEEDKTAWIRPALESVNTLLQECFNQSLLSASDLDAILDGTNLEVKGVRILPEIFNYSNDCEKPVKTLLGELNTEIARIESRGKTSAPTVDLTADTLA